MAFLINLLRLGYSATVLTRLQGGKYVCANQVEIGSVSGKHLWKVAYPSNQKEIDRVFVGRQRIVKRFQGFRSPATEPFS